MTSSAPGLRARRGSPRPLPARPAHSSHQLAAWPRPARPGPAHSSPALRLAPSVPRFRHAHSPASARQLPGWPRPRHASPRPRLGLSAPPRPRGPGQARRALRARAPALLRASLLPAGSPRRCFPPAPTQHPPAHPLTRSSHAQPLASSLAISLFAYPRAHLSRPRSLLHPRALRPARSFTLIHSCAHPLIQALTLHPPLAPVSWLPPGGLATCAGCSGHGDAPRAFRVLRTDRGTGDRNGRRALAVP